MANLLNLFWEEKLTGWDLDFSVGRRWVRMCGLERKAKFCQCWHAPEGRIDSLNNFLSGRLGISWGFWGETAARIAVLGMGLSKLLTQEEEAPFDLAVVGGNFSAVFAGLCLKAMGFPVGKVIICCKENNSP